MNFFTVVIALFCLAAHGADRDVFKLDDIEIKPNKVGANGFNLKIGKETHFLECWGCTNGELQERINAFNIGINKNPSQLFRLDRKKLEKMEHLSMVDDWTGLFGWEPMPNSDESIDGLRAKIESLNQQLADCRKSCGGKEPATVQHK